MTKKLKRPHIQIRHGKESFPYTPRTGGGGNDVKIPNRNRITHADNLKTQYNKIFEKDEKGNWEKYRLGGAYVQFKGKQNFDLIVKSLENMSQGVRLCNVQEENSVQNATVFIPLEKENFFLKKIDNYKNKKRDEKLIASIESIKKANILSLWTDQREIPQDKKEACEVWLFVGKKQTAKQIANNFFQLCDQFQITHYQDFIEFPERVVVSIMANKEILENLLVHSRNISGIRRNTTPATFFIENNIRAEQRDWCKDLLQRTTFTNTNLSICLLDKGVNNGHPLISPILKDDNMHTTLEDNDVQDKSNDGHGTAMAGIATYYNLQEALESNFNIQINHHLESVRIVDDSIQNRVDLYADVTSKAISLAEIAQPNNRRVIAMPITAPVNYGASKKNHYYSKGDGNPTSWSAGIDNIALGNYNEENADSRLIIVSGGNTQCQEIREVNDYKVAVENHSVEDPAQSWNALTIGAYTEIVTLSDDPSYKEYKPLVEKGSYSPINTSSLVWDNKWPIKPDIVLEGGNIGYNKNSEDFLYDTLDNFSLLTTRNKFNTQSYFTTINGTSSATAQAANLAVRIMHEYPGIWPQTVRAIMVHSASWSDAMIRQVFGDKKLKNIKKTELRQLLRIVGYGIPDVNQCLYSFNNSVDLIIEDELQPFIKESTKNPRINEMALHEIPWPSEVLSGLEDTRVKMKVTLSYFIEPSPSEVGWNNKYTYPSCRLYFDVNNINEDRETFLARVNQRILDEEKNKGNNIETSNDSSRWFLGKYNRDQGSIHSDIWEDTAANLAENRFIAVYPGTGWWKTRPHLNKYHSKIKYSLIVSISTPEESVDLYTPIESQIRLKNKAKITEQIIY